MRSAILIPVLAIATLARSQVQIPPNGAEEQSKNVVFNLLVGPEPESWATGTNCEMNAAARADSQPRWIQYVPYTGSEPWTSWKITEFKITLGDTIVWTGESAENEGAPRIIRAIRYASTHFPNGKATFKVSAKFVFYRNGVQGLVRELSATTQVKVYNRFFGWATRRRALGDMGDPDAAVQSWKAIDFNGTGASESEIKLERNQFAYQSRAAAYIAEMRMRMDHNTPFVSEISDAGSVGFLFRRVDGNPSPPETMSPKFDDGMSRATVFFSSSHGASTANGRALSTSQDGQAVTPVGIDFLIGQRNSSNPGLAPRPNLAILYTCYSTEDESLLAPFWIRRPEEMICVDRALLGFPNAVSSYCGSFNSDEGKYEVLYGISDHAFELMRELGSGNIAFYAAENANASKPLRSGLQASPMQLQGDPLFRAKNVYLTYTEWANPWIVLFWSESWFYPL